MAYLALAEKVVEKLAGLFLVFLNLVRLSIRFSTCIL
jgi:hypothetical protein